MEMGSSSGRLFLSAPGVPQARSILRLIPFIPSRSLAGQATETLVRSLDNLNPVAGKWIVTSRCEDPWFLFTPHGSLRAYEPDRDDVVVGTCIKTVTALLKVDWVARNVA